MPATRPAYGTADAVLAGLHVKIERVFGIHVANERPHRLVATDGKKPVLVVGLVDALARHGPYTVNGPIRSQFQSGFVWWICNHNAVLVGYGA